MSCSETDMGPSGGPCAICGEYPYAHQIESDHHQWCGLIWRLTHGKKLKRSLKASYEAWVLQEIADGNLYWKKHSDTFSYLARIQKNPNPFAG